MLKSAAEQIKQFLLNPVLLACVSSWFCAQFIKTVVNALYGRIHNISEIIENLLWKTGGLPSSHSALVSALCTTIGFKQGISSDVFILSFCFCMITVRDAVGVRRSSGLQAKKINELGRMLHEKRIATYIPIKEVQGHSPMEVTVGCLLGFFTGLAFSLF